MEPLDINIRRDKDAFDKFLFDKFIKDYEMPKKFIPPEGNLKSLLEHYPTEFYDWMWCAIFTSESIHELIKQAKDPYIYKR